MPKYSFKIYTSIREITPQWDSFGEDVFLQIPYLTAQELGSPKNMDYFYVGVFNQNHLLAKFVVQRVRVKGKELFLDSNQFTDELLNLLNLNVLCVGNVKLSGEHAWEIKPEFPSAVLYELIPKILEEIRKISKNQQIPVHLFLIKDFYKPLANELQAYFNAYEMLSVQPNMLFRKADSWQNFDDYLAAMRTKYRTRAKRAFKKADGIIFRELQIEEIHRLQKKMYELYQNVLHSNRFSLYILPENFFVSMKEEMGTKFNVFGGFLEDELISFYSVIENGNQLEAGFLGYNIAEQQSRQLYLNMLYQMLEYALNNGFETVDFSRTALEIKSSVGAEPHEMFGFLKHTNPLMNRLLKSTFRKFYQPEEWIPRNPFRE
ncbi:MAG: peptidogalycan biosysnthesis protein [Flavobacteriaceae bacterium]|nr:peptidogalycan biosysnthesis protein [Flavobacteriaceae bacterium]